MHGIPTCLFNKLGERAAHTCFHNMATIPGPLVAYSSNGWVLCGVTSQGVPDACGSSGTASTFANVYSAQSWITQTAGAGVVYVY